MTEYSKLLMAVIGGLALLGKSAAGQTGGASFAWPEGKRAAISLSFDDARPSQIDAGMGLLDRHAIRATFFVRPDRVEERLAGWRLAVAAGQEIGNHSASHPCSGSYPWSRDHALETYTLDQIRSDLTAANQRIVELLGVTPKVFAYPCGEITVGRGRTNRSYVPVVAELFAAGRGLGGEIPNEPGYCDIAKLISVSMDGKDFHDLRPMLEQVKERGQWLVLRGHEIGPSGVLTTRPETLDALITFAKDPANQFWIAPVGTVAEYMRARGGCR